MKDFRRVSMRLLLKNLRLFSVLALPLLLAVAALAQTETGVITGTVHDNSGAVVADANVTAKSVSTGLTRGVTTNSVGLYSFPALKADTYEVTIEAKGFQRYTRQVQVSVGSTNDISAQLTVGSSETVVEVSGVAENAAVNTETQTLSEIITSKQLDQLPTSPTRNPYALVGNAGNVAEDTNSDRGAGFAINGQRSASTGILLDGAENVDTYTATVGQPVPLDSVQEFSVLTNNFGAEFGRASGGVVNVVTKSGTNQFHGSAYEYNRISALSSNTYQNDSDRWAAFQDGTCVQGSPCTVGQKGTFVRNNFGFSIGGPVIKNKLFFFNNTEWIRVRSNAPLQQTIIDPGSYGLLAPASQAFFSQYGGLAKNVSTVRTVPCNATSGLTCDVVSFPVATDAGGGLPQNTWMEVAKIDYNLSSKTTISGRYASYKEDDFVGTVNASPYAGYNTGQNQYDQNYLFSLTHVFTPSVVNTTKLIYNRLNGPVQPLGTAPIGPTLYTSSTSVPSVGGFPLIYPGYSQTTPGNAIPFGGPQNLYQIYDDLSWTKGAHQLKFGGQFIQLRDNRVFGAYENAVEGLGTNLTTALDNLVAGQIYQFQGAVYPQGKYPCPKNAAGVSQVSPDCTLTLPATPPKFERNYHYNDLAFYGQDSWKVIPSFTLNAGLRWEYYGVQHNADPSLDSNFVMGQGATIYDQIRNGSVQLAQNGGVFWKPAYHNFGPRVGFAWDVFGDGKTAVRGGYGISYERNFGNVTYNTIQNPPNYGVISLIAGVDVPSMPVYTDNFGPLAGSGTKALPAVSQRAINQNLKTAYAETWNLTVERQFIGSSLLSVSYAGSRGIHLYSIANVNPADGGSIYLGDARTANRINYQYSNMNYRSDSGFSNYNSMNVKWVSNDLLHKGIGLTANYTWSHSLDNLSSTFSDGTYSNYALGFTDAFNPSLNYGNSDFDIRNRLNLAANWELPWFKSGNGFTRAVLGGWGTGAIFNVRSGAPFSIFDCNNYNGTTCPQWAQEGTLPRTGASTPTGQSNTFNYIALPSTAGVVDNQSVSLGMPVCTGLYHTGCTYTTDGSKYPGRNGFYGPGYWNLNMNFYKNFSLTERFKLQFRGEFYNIFNHSNQYISSLNLDVSSMSTPFIQTVKGGPLGYTGTSSDERRNVQLGLKLSF
jgi:outer membrane receptor protein involved in Fe transport